MANTTYTTESGDRWDTIAYKAYGDSTQYPAIIAANPKVAIVDVFAAGVKLNIPIKDPPTISTTNLPPWKR